MGIGRVIVVALSLLVAAPLGAAPPTDVAAREAYVSMVRQHLAGQRALLRPFYLGTGEVVLGLEIDREGHLVNGLIVSGSGSNDLDRAAARMATYAAPYAPPPPSLAAGDHVTVQVVLRLPADKATWDAWLAGAPEPSNW